MTDTVLALASTANMHWMIFGCVAAVLTSVTSFRILTRCFDWGPRDT
jgi:hypothetical protein